MEAFPLRAYGRLRFLCVVCGKRQALIALRVGPDLEIGLCSSRPCIEASDRDARFRSAARCGGSYVACQWAGVVQAAASFDPPPGPSASLAASRVVYMGPRRPADPRAPHTYTFGSDGPDD